MGMDRNCRPAGHRRRRLVSVPAAPVARDLRAMDRRPRDLGRRAVRAGLHSRHHLAHPGVVADDRCRLAVRRLGRCDHRRHGHDRRIGGLSDRPLSRAPRFTHCSNGGGYFPRSTTQLPRKAGRSSHCCASALGAIQSSELPIGVTAVSFRHFVAATLAGIIPGTVLYTFTSAHSARLRGTAAFPPGR